MGAVTIGVDAGGTKTAAGLVDETGAVLARGRRDTPVQDAAASIQVIRALVAELVAAAGTLGLEPPAGVGIGAAGFIDRSRRRVTFAANLGWDETAVADLVEPGFDLPVVVENDANAASWGEFCFGAGREHDDMVCVTVGTGIGGGIVSEGRLVRGAYGVAAEVGHVVTVPGGRPCGCGRRGCWEQYASGNALVRKARELASERRADARLLLAHGDGTPEGVKGEHISAAAEGGTRWRSRRSRRSADGSGAGSPTSPRSWTRRCSSSAGVSSRPGSCCSARRGRRSSRASSERVTARSRAWCRPCSATMPASSAPPASPDRPRRTGASTSTTVDRSVAARRHSDTSDPTARDPRRDTLVFGRSPVLL